MPAATFPTARLVIVGALHVDEIATSDEPLIARASNAVSWQRSVGGVATNAALAARAASPNDTSVQLYAAIGNDAVSNQLAHVLQAAGLDSELHRVPDKPTGRYTAIMDNDGELYIGLSDAALAETLPAEAVNLTKDLLPCRALLMDANLSADCLQNLSRHARNCAIPLAAMSVAPLKARRLLPIADRIDLLYVNRREAIAMTMDDTSPDVPLETLADHLSAHGFATVVITDGSQPLLVQSADDRTQLAIPSIPKCRSVNGAGDALAGASFAAWSAGVNLVESVRDVGLPQARQVLLGTYRQPRLI